MELRSTPDGALALDPATRCVDCGGPVFFVAAPRHEGIFPVEAAGFDGQFELTFHPSGDYHGRWIRPEDRTIERAPYYAPHADRCPVRRHEVAPEEV